MSRHRYRVEPHAEVDLFDALVPEPRSATSPPGGARRARPEWAESSDWPLLPSPRISQSGPMSVVAPVLEVPAPRLPEPGSHWGPDAHTATQPDPAPDDVVDAAHAPDTVQDWHTSTTPDQGWERDTFDWAPWDGAQDEAPVQNSRYAQTGEPSTATGWGPSTNLQPVAEPLPAPPPVEDDRPSHTSTWSADLEPSNPAAYDTPPPTDSWTQSQSAQPPTAPGTAPVVTPTGNVEPTTALRPVDEIRHDDVTDPTGLLHLHATGPARSTQHSTQAGTHQAPAARAGTLALVTCTVLGLVVGAAATVAFGKTFWSNPDRGASPAQVGAAPPILTPATDVPQAPPATPAPQRAPIRPQEQSGETHQKATTGRSGGAAKPSLLAQGPVRNLHIWLTGYSFQDNTPPSSAIVSAPIMHKTAGGTGTYANPITVAVPGHASDGDMAWKGGTRFYLPTVQRYAIVEDSGASPAPSGQDGHLDMWVDGQGGSKSASDSCMDKITGAGIPAIMNPPPGKPVIVGPITSNGTCHVPAATGSTD
jgi:hypothetical protein